jgi:hypothetical protein
MTVLYLRASRQCERPGALFVGSTIEEGTRGFTLKNDGFPSMAVRAMADKAVV